MSRYGNEEGRTIVANAKKAVTRLGPKAAAFLDSTSLGNSPAVLMALAAYQRGEFRMSPETAQVELDKLTKDLRSKPYYNYPAYRDSNHPKHRVAVDRATALYELRYRDE